MGETALSSSPIRVHPITAPLPPSPMIRPQTLRRALIASRPFARARIGVQRKRPLCIALAIVGRHSCVDPAMKSTTCSALPVMLRLLDHQVRVGYLRANHLSVTLTTLGNEASFNSDRDDVVEPISNDNAQALLPPSACVFVAK